MIDVDAVMPIFIPAGTTMPRPIRRFRLFAASFSRRPGLRIRRSRRPAQAVRQARNAAAGRADPLLRRQARQGRADPGHQAEGSPRHRHAHLEPAPSLSHADRARLCAGAQGHQGDQVAKGRKPRAVYVRRDRRQAHRHPRQGPWPRRNARPGDRVFRLAHERAAVRAQRPGLSGKAAGDLDPGSGRGHAPLASLLRLSQ